MRCPQRSAFRTRAEWRARIRWRQSTLQGSHEETHRRDFRAREESCWNFFCWPLSSIARSELGGDLVSANHSVYAGREEQRPQPLHWAAAYPLQPLHCSRRQLTAARIPEGIHNHYTIVMFGKPKIFRGRLMFALRVLRSYSTRGLWSFNDNNVMLNP